METFIMHRLFVYGTLRKNQNNNYYLKNSRFEGLDSIKGFIMLDFGDYPMIFEAGAEDIIIVEIFEVDEYTLKRIDILEGYKGDFNINNLYSRKIVESMSGLSGYIYTIESPDKFPGLNIIKSGDWLSKSHK